MISIVSVYDNEKVLNDYLLRGLNKQTVDFELIKIDNTKGIFKSAADGLNYGGKKAKGEYIIFIHQDVYLMSADWLKKAVSFLNKIPNLGIAGIAGMRPSKVNGISGFGECVLENRIGYAYQDFKGEQGLATEDFAQPVKVRTLDEQLLIIPKDIFKKIKFDEKVCAGWHLYGVDYSLSVKKSGLIPYVLPLPVCHRSGGELNGEYFVSLKKIFNKHQEQKIIYTTCGLWYNSLFLNCLNLIVMAIRAEIGRCIGRNKVGASRYIKRIKWVLNSMK